MPTDLGRPETLLSEKDLRGLAAGRGAERTGIGDN